MAIWGGSGAAPEKKGAGWGVQPRSLQLRCQLEHPEHNQVAMRTVPLPTLTPAPP